MSERGATIADPHSIDLMDRAMLTVISTMACAVSANHEGACEFGRRLADEYNEAQRRTIGNRAGRLITWADIAVFLTTFLPYLAEEADRERFS